MSDRVSRRHRTCGRGKRITGTARLVVGEGDTYLLMSLLFCLLPFAFNLDAAASSSAILSFQQHEIISCSPLLCGVHSPALKGYPCDRRPMWRQPGHLLNYDRHLHRSRWHYPGMVGIYSPREHRMSWWSGMSLVHMDWWYWPSSLPGYAWSVVYVGNVEKRVCCSERCLWCIHFWLLIW